MLYGLKRIPRWSSSLKTPQIPGCLQIQTGFAAPHEVQMSATGEQFVTLVQVWTEEGDEVRFDRAPLADIQTTGSECLLGGHRSIVPAARPETHPLLPWRWMSRLWCQASHRLFHIGDRKIHFLIVFFCFVFNPHSVYLRHFNTIDVNRWTASEGRKWPISTCVFVRFKLIQRRWVNKHLTAH